MVARMYTLRSGRPGGDPPSNPVIQIQAVRILLTTTVLTILFCSPGLAENKSLKSELEQALVGKMAVANVMLGEKAIPRGYSADYPVHTIVSKDGSISYRVEFGLMQQDVMTPNLVKRIERGTSVRISKLEMKDDHLELKVESVANSNETAKLKLMFGAGWQSSLGSSTVLQLVSTLLPEKLQDQSAVAAAPSQRATDLVFLVTDRVSKQPVADAAILRCEPQVGCEQALAKTDQTGKAVVPNIGDQTLDIVVARPGFKGFRGYVPVGAHRLFSITLQPMPRVEDVNVVVPPQEITPNGRAQWAAKLGEKYSGMLVGGACQFAAVGEHKDRLVGQCDMRGWMSVANAFATSAAPAANQKELYIRGFTSFHLNPYTDGMYAVDIKGSTIEMLVTERGLREPSLDAICATKANDSPQDRAEFATLYAALVKDAGCEVKIGGTENQVLMLSCRQSTSQQFATVYSEPVLIPSLAKHGFKTFVLSQGNETFVPSTITDSGLSKTSPITSAQLLQQYGIKSAEEIAKEEADQQAYTSFIEAFVDKMLQYSNAKHARKYASATWTQADWHEYNKALKSEASYIAGLGSNAFVHRPSFWKDSQDYATAYVGKGVWRGAPTGAFGTSVSTGSSAKDAQVRAELLGEIDQIHKLVDQASRRTTLGSLSER